MKDETVWLNTEQIAELFDKDRTKEIIVSLILNFIDN